MAALQHSRFCKGCWEQMHLPVPLRGVISAPFRAFGVRPSRMNPNTCTICELMFTKVMRARKITIDATIMFADLRGYTGLSQSQSPDAVSGLLDAFYDECAVLWRKHYKNFERPGIRPQQRRRPCQEARYFPSKPYRP